MECLAQCLPGKCSVSINGVLFLLAAFDEPHEPTALGLTWGGLLSSANVEPQ